ncbi:MAG: phospholipid carrier-dependent glycosyltransferase [Calditrichaeota bacterium]|nr:MAG: phospholipid carrier-dependent glycosyltransferase [Calditrichota bacterium]
MSLTSQQQDRVYLLILTAVYLALALPHLKLPGIQYDEVYHVPPAVAILKGHLGGEPVQIDPSVIHLFGRPFPLMFNYYTGFVKTYLCLPFFAVFGFNVFSIRGTSLLLGWIALIFTYLFARDLTRNRGLAFIAALLMATDASYLFYTRNDYTVIGTMMAFKMISLYYLLKWWRELKPRDLWIGAFTMGLGISDRASFLWILFSLAAFVVLFMLPQMRERWRAGAITRKMVLSGAVALALGAAIFIAFNVATLGGTFRPMTRTFVQPSGPVNNLAFLSNLHLRLQMLTDVLSGSYLWHQYFDTPRYVTQHWVWAGSLLTYAFILAFVFGLAQMMFTYRKTRIVPLPMAFLLFMSLALLFWSCFTPTSFRGHQLIMLYPFIHILIALFFWQGSKWFANWYAREKSRTTLQYVTAFGLMGLVVLSNLWVIRGYYQDFIRTGGAGVWSDAIYELVDYLEKHPEWTVVCMDWGFNQNILSLSAGEVKTLRRYYETDLKDENSLKGLFHDNHVFLLHTKKFTYLERPSRIFYRAVQAWHARLQRVKSFYQRDGQEVYRLYRVLPANDTAP